MRITARIDTTTGVERAADGTPTAWRIWKFGDNPTAHGPTRFTQRSATLLMQEQTQRGVKYPIDVEHQSLQPNAPLEDRRAVGWHSLEVRADGLWAVNAEWSPEAVDWLRTRAFRYTSAAYDLDSKTKEVVSYVNIAICNLPATENTVSIAASRTARADRVTRETAARAIEFLREAAKGTDAVAMEAAIALRKIGVPVDPMLAQRMGCRSQEPSILRKGCSTTFRPMSCEDAERHITARAAR